MPEQDDNYDGVDDIKLTVLDQEDNYDGVDDLEHNPRITKGADSVTNHTEKKHTQNPYYEGDFDALTEGNERSKKNPIYPDLSNTETVTSTQNVYYEL